MKTKVIVALDTIQQDVDEIKTSHESAFALNIKLISHLPNGIVQKRYVEVSMHGSIPSIIHQTTRDIWMSDRRIPVVG